MPDYIECDSHKIALDKEGFLLNLEEWTPALAEQLALRESVELDESHWEILTLLRNFYADRQVAPITRILVKLVELELGGSKGNSLYLLRLFPGSPAKIAAKIAGLPRPTNCL